MNASFLSYRVRIKPSWSGRVYGTYTVGWRHFLLCAVLCLALPALLGRALVLNLAEPSLDREIRSLRLANAHLWAVQEIAQPALVRQLEARTRESHERAAQLSLMLGIHQASTPRRGLGRVDESGDTDDLSARVELERLRTEVGALLGRYERLSQELVVRETELRYTPSVVPIQGAEFVPTSAFGPRISPFTRLPEIHRGQDLAADLRTPIVATADGVVAFVEQDPSRSRMGRYLVIDHDGRFQTSYGHCEEILVSVGSPVKRHQVVASVGNTGRSTGPHVHYEVRVAGEPQDPRHFMVFDPHFQAAEDFRLD